MQNNFSTPQRRVCIARSSQSYNNIPPSVKNISLINGRLHYIGNVETTMAELKLSNPFESDTNKVLWCRAKRLFPPIDTLELCQYRHAADEKKTQLFQHVKTGNVKGINELIASGIESKTLNILNEQGMPALIEALYTGCNAVVDALLNAHGIDVTARDERQHSPLMVAAFMGNAPAVNKLLQKLHSHIDEINAVAADGRTALFIACQAGHLDVVNLLVEVPAINMICPELTDGKTILYWAIMYGKIGLTKTLLNANNTNIRQLDKYKNTALMVAVSMGFSNIFRIVLEKFAQDVDSINAVNVEGFTVVHFAAHFNQITMLDELLKKKGVETNLGTVRGETPLALASYKEHIEIVKMLENVQKSDGNRCDFIKERHQTLSGKNKQD